MSLLTSLTRYSMAVVGSGVYEKKFRTLETQLSNVAARRIVGLGISARIETLNAVAGLMSAHNLYLRTCSALLDRSLRATRSSIKNRLEKWLSRAYAITSWKPEIVKVTPATVRLARTSTVGIKEVDVKEEWFCSLLQGVPHIPERFTVPSIFYTEADEINSDMEMKEKTYNFRNVNTWYEAGLQVLHASGWGPECAVADIFNTTRALPPKGKKEAQFVIGNFEMMDWIDTPDFGYSNDIPLPDLSKPADIEVVTFLEKSYAYSCLTFTHPEGEITCQGWVFGWDNTPVIPVYVHEFAILHALSFLLRELKKGANFSPSIIHVRAGRNLDCLRLLRWFNEGFFGLQSAAGSALIGVIREIMEILPCHLLLSSSDGGKWFRGEIDKIGTPLSFIEGTRRRLLKGVIESDSAEMLSRVPRVPLTRDEIMERVQCRYENDEILALKLLAMKGSASCALYVEWQLSRAIIKRTFVELYFNRRQQVTLASILTGTRFKYFPGRGEEEGGGLLQTLCPHCGEVDSIPHLISHFGKPVPPNSPEELVGYLAGLAQTGSTVNPHIPTPSRPLMATEIDLDMEEGCSEADSDLQELLFDRAGESSEQ